jgi:hypothetical protein
VIQRLALHHGARVRAMTLPILAAVVLASDVSAMGSHQAVAARLGRALQMPEAMLVQALIDIRDNRLAAALNRVNALLAVKPDFRLAQLIKGDLSRARPIARMGAADAPIERLDDLRDEARARLTRYAMQPPKDRVPRYLLQLQPEQRYAVVVDTGKSTLYLLRTGRHAALPHRTITSRSGRTGSTNCAKATRNAARGVSRDQPAAARKLTRSTAPGRFPSATPTNSTFAKAATVTGSGCTARRATPTAAPRAPATGAWCWPTRIWTT